MCLHFHHEMMTRPSSRRSFIISVTPCCSCAASYLLISKIVKANDTMRCQAECCLGIRVCGFMPALARKIKGAQSADWCQCPWAVVQLGSTFFLTRLRSFASSSSSSSKLIYFEMTVASRRRVSSTISKLIYQYELQTALYMLEPWEKALFSKPYADLFSISQPI